MSQLPEGWSLSNFGELTHTKSGNSKLIKGKLSAQPTGGSPFPAFSASGQDVWTSTPEHSGDAVIVSAVGARCGKAFLASGEWSAIANTHVVWPRQGFLNVRLLWYRINDESFWVKGGSAQPFVKVGSTFESPFALPPANEQKRIADKLDTVLTRVDAVNTRLARVAPLLKRFRQSVLAEATSGRLTEEWRTDAVYLSWSEKKYGEISQFHNGYAFKSEIFKSTGDIQIVKLANIKDGSIKLDASPAYVDTQDVLGQISEIPNAGDILISMTGTKYKRDYGFVCAVPSDIRLLINQRVGRFIPDKKIVSGKYLMITLMSSDFRDQFFEGETGGVNQGNVGSGHIKNCTLLLPSIHEQTEIVRRVETLFAFADRLEARLQTAQTAADRLTPSLLAKAFRGELVPQDPNDEPASELLRRLKLDAVTKTVAKRGRRKTELT